MPAPRHGRSERQPSEHYPARIGSALTSLGTRLQLVGFIPTAMSLWVLVVMVAADAPHAELSYSTLAEAMKSIGLPGAALVAGAALGLSVTLQPLQFRMVQLLEGYWSMRRLPWLFRIGYRRQRRRLERALRDAEVETDLDEVEERLQDERAAAAEEAVRIRFPETERLLPTALGNVLRSAEDRIGRRYGVDSIVLWPRMFPLLPTEFAANFEDEVTQLDVSSRLTVTWAATGVAGSGVLLTDPGGLGEHPSWILLIGLLAFFSWLSYRGAIESALRHGRDIEVALDLYRHRVLDAAKLPEPRRLSQEQQQFMKLCELYGMDDLQKGFDLRYRTNQTPSK